MTSHGLDLICVDNGTETRARFAPGRLIIAGWTGRDRAAMEHHMAELEALGITRPDHTPVFYRNAVTRLVTSDLLQTPGPGSSGEVEFVLLNLDGEIWVGVGSDHTDRDVEAYNITVSKQMCDKPIGARVWRFEALREVWDTLRIESRAVIDGQDVVYQQGTVAKMLSAEDLIAEFERQTGTKFRAGDVMMGGTLPAIGGVRPATRFSCALIDPRTGDRLEHSYDIDVIENLG